MFLFSIEEVEGAFNLHGFQEYYNRNAIEIIKTVILLDQVEKALQQIVLQRAETITAMILQFFPHPFLHAMQIQSVIDSFFYHKLPQQECVRPHMKFGP
jgi:hypothetical protein